MTNSKNLPLALAQAAKFAEQSARLVRRHGLEISEVLTGIERHWLSVDLGTTVVRACVNIAFDLSLGVGTEVWDLKRREAKRVYGRLVEKYGEPKKKRASPEWGGFVVEWFPSESIWGPGFGVVLHGWLPDTCRLIEKTVEVPAVEAQPATTKVQREIVCE